MMLQMLRAAMLWLRQTIEIDGGVRKVVVEPLITVTMLLSLYAGWHVMQGRSIEEGLRAAFLDSDAIRAERRRARDAATLQTELHHFAVANRQIETLLRSLMQRAPTAARAHVNVIHNGLPSGGTTNLLRYDVIDQVTAPNKEDDNRPLDQPLSNWDDFLPALLAGACYFDQTTDMRVDGRRLHLLGDGIAAFLACPMTDRRGTLLGDVTLAWESPDAPPADDSLRTLIASARAVSARIGAVLDGQALADSTATSGAPDP